MRAIASGGEDVLVCGVVFVPPGDGASLRPSRLPLVGRPYWQINRVFDSENSLICTLEDNLNEASEPPEILWARLEGIMVSHKGAIWNSNPWKFWGCWNNRGMSPIPTERVVATYGGKGEVYCGSSSPSRAAIHAWSFREVQRALDLFGLGLYALTLAQRIEVECLVAAEKYKRLRQLGYLSPTGRRLRESPLWLPFP